MGKVKTRLAKTIGDKLALEVYKSLLNKTAKVTSGLSCNRYVFYSKHAENDEFDGAIKLVQRGTDLGGKLQHAFIQVFNDECNKVIVIGSDCYDLSTDVIENAFKILDSKDAVIGPAKDGGYYLLGMRKMSEEVFQDIPWSTKDVYEQTVEKFRMLNWSFERLEELKDVDYEADLPQDWKKLLINQ